MAESPQYASIRPRARPWLSKLLGLGPTKRKKKPSAPQPLRLSVYLGIGRDCQRSPRVPPLPCLRPCARHSYPGSPDSAVTCAPHETGTYLALVSMGQSRTPLAAYSRPGGARPLCNLTDVTPAMIDAYRKTANAQR